MLFSLLDDSHFRSSEKSECVDYKKIFSFILTLIAIFLIMVITITLYKITWENGKIDVLIREL